MLKPNIRGKSTQLYLFIFLLIFSQLPSLVFAKKKLLLITDLGGGGHLSTADAVTQALKDDFEVLPITPFENFPGRAKETFNQDLKAGIYSRKLWLYAHNHDWAERYLSWNRGSARKMRQDLQDQITGFKPDLIISVAPIGNWITYSLAKKSTPEIPFLILPTDIEDRHFYWSIRNPGSNLKAALLYEGDESRKRFSKNWKPENFVVTGYALRHPFTQSTRELQPEIDKIRKGISVDDKIVLLMMGNQGSGAGLLKYTQWIASFDFTKQLQTRNRDSKSRGGKKLEGAIHVFVICGNNDRALEGVRGIRSSDDRILIHPLGKQEPTVVAALMRTSDVLVTKPGGASVNEALASQIFTLFDAKSTSALWWEKVNMKYSIDLGAGEVIRTASIAHTEARRTEISRKLFLRQLDKALRREDRPKIDNCPGRNFSDNIRTVAAKMISGVN